LTYSLLVASSLTGESLPEVIARGHEALSGATSVGSAFELIASRPAAESTYARIVALFEHAQSSKAPITRLADRYAVGLLIVTVALAGAAWLFSGESIRGLAVL